MKNVYFFGKTINFKGLCNPKNLVKLGFWSDKNVTYLKKIASLSVNKDIFLKLNF